MVWDVRAMLDEVQETSGSQCRVVTAPLVETNAINHCK